MIRRLFIFIAALCFSVLGLRASTLADSVKQAADGAWQVSLLTCAPGKEVYEYYGHTALRLRSEAHGDWVFNYGSFSFDKPGFVWRFVKGETDYELAVVPYAFFEMAYAQDGRAIFEQKLNLTAAEAARLEAALAENLQPQNATYRYNFFFDNCVTRAIGRIEEAVDGEVVWPKAQKGLTLRGIVDEFSAVSPWNRFGQDLLLGAEADRPADRPQQMFAPLYAEQYVSGAKIKDRSGRLRPLAQPVEVALPATETVQNSESSAFTPLVAVMLLLLMSVACVVYELKNGKEIWPWAAFLLTLQGVVGLPVSFLFLFSAHPTVGENLLVLAFNPLPLLVLPWYLKSASQGRAHGFTSFNALLLSLTLVLGLLGVQHLSLEIMLFLLSILLMMVRVRGVLAALSGKWRVLKRE